MSKGLIILGVLVYTVVTVILSIFVVQPAKPIIDIKSEKLVTLVEQDSDILNPEAPMSQRNKAVRILAKSIFRELTAQGYDERQIVSLATELIGEVTTNISSKSAPAQD